MFDSLTDRLQDVFRQIRGEGRLTEETVEAALREIRMALLEADVNFKVVKAFIDRVRDRAVDQEVLRSLTPDQQVVRIVRDEMLALFGDAQGGLPPSQRTAARHPAARAPGLGQDDDVGEARASGWRSRGGIRCWSRPTCGARRRSSSCRSSASRPACACTIRPARWIRSRAPRAR